MTSPLPGYAGHFGPDNIPFGVASSKSHPDPSCVTRLGDNVIFLNDITDQFSETVIADLPAGVFGHGSLNHFAALGRPVHSATRRDLQELFRKDAALSSIPSRCVENISAVSVHLPVLVGDFTDFSCSHHHAQGASEAMTGKRSVPPAFFNMPIGYAGRCSSLDVSGTPVERPVGQFVEGRPGESEVQFGPCRKMDYELELGCIVGKPVERREKVYAAQADEHIFGYVLVNDWSARDIQALEMIPLGPLNGKNAGTTVSPWIVTTDALAQFRTASPSRTHPPLPYLADSGKEALHVELNVSVIPSGQDSSRASVYCKSNSALMYWTLGQCLAHQAIGGCGLRTGDLLCTGTVSGPGADERGCLLEHMRIGEKAPRGYVEDGETVTLSGYCGEGVGFGECTAALVAAREI